MIYLWAAIYGAMGLFCLFALITGLRKRGPSDWPMLGLLAFTTLAVIGLIVASFITESISYYGLIGLPSLAMMAWSHKRNKKSQDDE
ncbi:MAG: hypothetical protein LBC41_12745 [Clostridiales bacterium]|nr:hypothetical protein [Clostridiales bacterium]MDR2751519.1 hypothetical protein [Clostridiales bacterium]